MADWAPGVSEETQIKPKPMVEIGGRSMLWHIMKIYERHGLNEFVPTFGYNGWQSKDCTLNRHAHFSGLTVHQKNGLTDQGNPTAEDWHVSLAGAGAITIRREI